MNILLEAYAIEYRYSKPAQNPDKMLIAKNSRWTKSRIVQNPLWAIEDRKLDNLGSCPFGIFPIGDLCVQSSSILRFCPIRDFVIFFEIFVRQRRQPQNMKVLIDREKLLGLR